MARPSVSDVSGLLDAGSIVLDGVAGSKDEAIELVGSLLVASGAVEPAYVAAMHEREEAVSTFLGEGVAIPHGTLEAKDAVVRDALAYVRFPAGVDWDGHRAFVAVGIAARGTGHIAILAELAGILIDPDRARALREADTPDAVLALLAPGAD